MNKKVLLKYEKPNIKSISIDSQILLIMASGPSSGSGDNSGETPGPVRPGRGKSATIDDVNDINYNQFNENPFE